jgi:hypothetical protein
MCHMDEGILKDRRGINGLAGTWQQVAAQNANMFWLLESLFRPTLCFVSSGIQSLGQVGRDRNSDDDRTGGARLLHAHGSTVPKFCPRARRDGMSGMM